MATKARKAQTLDVKLDAKPGALFRVYSAFKEAGVNVTASWGYEMGPGEAQAHLCVTDTGKATDVLSKMKMKPTTSDVCIVEADDTVGTYATLLEKVMKAGININATDALSMGGKFVTVFFTDKKDYPALCKALGC